VKGRGIALLILGLAQIAGDLGGIPALKGIAAATNASPAPKVFSAVRGLETYSTKFHVEWKDDAGERSLDLDSEKYHRILGPYNRRNIYGATLAYGPVLASDPRTRPMFDAVARHALCAEAPLLTELGAAPQGAVTGARVRLTPREGSHPDVPSLDLEIRCR